MRNTNNERRGVLRRILGPQARERGPQVEDMGPRGRIDAPLPLEGVRGHGEGISVYEISRGRMKRKWVAGEGEVHNQVPGLESEAIFQVLDSPLHLGSILCVC